MTSCDILPAFLSAIEEDSRGRDYNKLQYLFKGVSYNKMQVVLIDHRKSHFRYCAEIHFLMHFPTVITPSMIQFTYCLEVICIVYFFGHEIVHIC